MVSKLRSASWMSSRPLAEGGAASRASGSVHRDGPWRRRTQRRRLDLRLRRRLMTGAPAQNPIEAKADNARQGRSDEKP